MTWYIVGGGILLWIAACVLRKACVKLIDVIAALEFRSAINAGENIFGGKR